MQGWNWLAGECAVAGAFCQFLFRWIYYYDNNESDGKETGKTHLCVYWASLEMIFIFEKAFGL